MSRNALAVFDLDGTLIRLALDAVTIRKDLNALFEKEGIQIGKPIYKMLDEALEKVPHLRNEAWGILDAAERRGAKEAKPCEGVHELLAATRDIPRVIYSNNLEEAVVAGLKNSGVNPGEFLKIYARTGPKAPKPSGAPILSALDTFGKEGTRVFMVGDHVVDMIAAREARAIAIGIYRDFEHAQELEKSGADFLVFGLSEVEPFLTQRPVTSSLSIVLLAYQEKDNIVAAVNDAARFCELYVPRHEIVVVDDGSRDGTADKLRSISKSVLKIVTHDKNLGMGASMRDGYRAASMQFMAHLPGDRQVRPQALLSFFRSMALGRVVLSSYINPPSGLQRSWISALFRWMVKWIGGMSVDFAGTYLFHRDLFAQTDPKKLYSDSFVYSFEILQRFKELGAEFSRVKIRTFPRSSGASAEFLFTRILKVFRELILVRIKRLIHG